MKLSSFKTAAAALMLAAALSGCVVAPVPYGGAVAYEAPPPPRYEVIGVAPAPGYFWIGGAWFFEGGRYQWHPGRWSAPRPGYSWVAHSWTHEGNAWHMHPGRWEAVHRAS